MKTKRKSIGELIRYTRHVDGKYICDAVATDDIKDIFEQEIQRICNTVSKEYKKNGVVSTKLTLAEYEHNLRRLAGLDLFKEPVPK